MNKHEVRAWIADVGIIPAVRVRSADDARFAAEASLEAGFRSWRLPSLRCYRPVRRDCRFSGGPRDIVYFYSNTIPGCAEPHPPSRAISSSASRRRRVTLIERACSLVFPRLSSQRMISST